MSPVARQAPPAAAWLPLSILVIAGCIGGLSESPASTTAAAAPSARTWALDVPAPGEVARTAFTVRDFTGLVAEVRNGQTARDGIASRSLAIEQDQGDASEVRVSWTSSVCAAESHLSIENVAQQLLFSAHSSPSQDCDTMAVSYPLAIKLARELALRQVVAHDDQGGRSWGLLVVGTDGKSRPILVLDETRLSTLVTPLDPRVIPQGIGAIDAQAQADNPSLVRLVWASDACDDAATVSVSREGKALMIELEVDRSDSDACGGRQVQGLGLTFKEGNSWSTIDARVVR